MKVFRRRFVFPIMVHKTNSIYTDRPNISIRWNRCKMGGSARNTSYTLQIIAKGKEFQWSFVWRPDVTRYWWKSCGLSKKKGLRTNRF